MNQPLRIVKVGGSLFQNDQLPLLLKRWLDDQPPAQNILIAGGGKLVDAIRDADQRFRLGEEASHWLSIQAMSVTARMLAELLDVPLIKDVTCADADRSVHVLDAYQFLQSDSGHPLPQSWSVTSDSIAAKVAADYRCELVLLK